MKIKKQNDEVSSWNSLHDVKVITLTQFRISALKFLKRITHKQKVNMY